MNDFLILFIIILLIIIFIFLGVFVFFKKDNSNNPPIIKKDSFELDVEIIDLTYRFGIVSRGTLVSLNLDWGDGTIETFTDEPTILILTHTYTNPGNYKIKCIDVSGYEGITNNFSTPIIDKITNVKVTDMKDTTFLTFVDSLLTTLDIKGLNKIVNLNLQQNTLTQESIDNILVTFNNFNTTYQIGTDGGNIDLSNQNPPTAPTVIGLAAKTALESRNWTVLVDP